MSKRWTNLNSIGRDLELKESQGNMFWCFFWDFLRPCFKSHLLITKRISFSKTLPANRKRDFRSESTGRTEKWKKMSWIQNTCQCECTSISVTLVALRPRRPSEGAVRIFFNLMTEPGVWRRTSVAFEPQNVMGTWNEVNYRVIMR